MAALVYLGFLGAQSALAGYPPLGSSISDLADVLPNRDQAALLESIAWFKRTTKADLRIVTLPSWKVLGTSDKTWESFNTNLFNRWGVGLKARNDGVLFVAAIAERQLRIELGAGFKRCYDPVMKRILEQNVKPLFKETRYGAGMVLGTKSIIQALPKLCPAQAPKPINTPVSAPSFSAPSFQVLQPPPQPFLPWLPVGAGLTVLGAWAGLRGLRRPKRCPNCQGTLEQMQEQQDDEFLTQGQQLEERLQSVNYEVWLCRTCHSHQLIKRPSWFSSYAACPSCQHQTLIGQQTPLFPPSETSQGLARLDRHCKHCQHRDSQDIILPRLNRDVNNRRSFHAINASNLSEPRQSSQSNHTASSNSKSNNSGGGRSDGGGASGSW